MMVGGDDDVVERLFPIFETLAPAKDKGWDTSTRRPRSLRQDGSQRHRIRNDAGLCEAFPSWKRKQR